jgi:hypothetical protein
MQLPVKLPRTLAILVTQIFLRQIQCPQRDLNQCGSIPFVSSLPPISGMEYSAKSPSQSRTLPLGRLRPLFHYTRFRAATMLIPSSQPPTNTEHRTHLPRRPRRNSAINRRKPIAFASSIRSQLRALRVRIPPRGGARWRRDYCSRLN